MEPEKIHDNHTCKACGLAFSGSYCNRCGEKVLSPDEKSFRHFLSNVLNAFTFIDSKFYKTLRLMLLKPGYVSAQVIDGIRVPYIRPLSMFFIVNLFYFLFTVSDTYNSRLYSQMNLMPYSSVTKKIVEQKIKAEKISIDAFRVNYEQQSTSLAKLLLIIFVLFTGLCIALFNIKSNKYFYDHITVSLEFNAMFILMGNIALKLFALLITQFMLLFDVLLEQYLTDPVYTSIAGLLAVILLFSMQRRVYHNTVVWSLIKALAFIPCLAISMIAYRAILFFATIWTI
ncbi:MAG TPA: DUF3667 domain-containing protein [Cyclobacteriaceae bacterium]|nr:DUF3667 domain-containing protein [Cyclobacteriaceae bacterium]HRJ81467.1 DUF3667 domain-containing protein [Cyclobacteriaceae bacterium]